WRVDVDVRAALLSIAEDRTNAYLFNFFFLKSKTRPSPHPPPPSSLLTSHMSLLFVAF
ncbi:unnamed protein product, partial [Prunus brigantina]